MALPMVPIFTQTVGAGGSSGITFNNIPQSFTDLKLLISARESSTGTVYAGGYLYFNGVNSGTLVSTTKLIVEIAGTPQSTRTSNAGNSFPIPTITAASATASTFNSAEIYIPNYAGSNFKQIIADYAVENNSTSTYGFYLGLGSILYSSTNPITSLSIMPSGSFVQYTTVSLYGILRAGA